MTDLAAQATAALERSVLPSVIARGGAVRVAAASNGVVTLEVTGSPGAVFPLASRIEAVICAAVPAITAVRLITPGRGTTGSHPGAADLGDAARRVLDAEVNPAIAAHRGHVTVTGADQGWIQIPANSPVGTVIATLAIAMSDESEFAGTISGAVAPWSVQGLNVVTTETPLPYPPSFTELALTATQNGFADSTT